MNVYGQRISEQLVLDAFHVMLNPDRYPVIVMCNLGRHRTGTVIGCLRRLQLWSLSSIVDEFRRFNGLKQSALHEQFIELFDIDLVEFPKELSRLPFKIRYKQINNAGENGGNVIQRGGKMINSIFGPRTR